MKQTREIQNFIFSQYFSDGVRIALGGVLPSLILAQYGLLPVGIIVSLGALTVSIADNSGPVVHKRNGMLFCILFIFITALLTGFINTHPILLILEILVFGFFFSMITVYGNRASAVGTAALLIMVLTIDQELDLKGAILHATFLLAGGLWYFILSMCVSQIRPYRLAQQELGICIREVASYLRVKADFYDQDKDFEETYHQLISKQVEVNAEQDAVRELLFKSRIVIKESTVSGRQLVLVFVDILDLFERTMATHYDYQAIRRSFGDTGVLLDFKNVIVKISEELENLSYYITGNITPKPLFDLQQDLEQLKIKIDKVESDHGINNLVLKKILINMRNIVNRVQKIYSYYQLRNTPLDQPRTEADVIRFISHQDYDIKVFKENLGLQSSIFRHSLRVSIVLAAGYLISISLPFGYHSYWILLTILVILKPGFSLTKQRNFQRVIGTLVGGIVGACVVVYIKDETARFILLLLFMILAYSFQRLNYIVSVLFMTPYILIMFSFIGYGNLSIARERILDTIIGSVIAFTASYFILPSWEYFQIKKFEREILVANYNYLYKVAEQLAGKELNITEYKLARKEVYVSSANLGSAFQRMLSEPKSKQKNAKDMHKFVVLNHMLSSYIATLISTLTTTESHLRNPNHIKAVRKSLRVLADTIRLFDKENGDFKDAEISIPLTTNQPVEENMDTKLITEQLDFLNNVAGDIQKISQTLKN